MTLDATSNAILHFPTTAVAYSASEPHRAQPKFVIRDADASTSVYNSPESEGAFSQHYSRLNEIAVDPSLWPEGVAAPSPIAIKWARVVLQQFEKVSAVPTRIVASGEGGIAICFVDGNKYSDIECSNSGTILGVNSNRHDRPIVWEVEQSASGIAWSVARISGFIQRPPSTTKNVSRKPSGRWELSTAS